MTACIQSVAMSGWELRRDQTRGIVGPGVWLVRPVYQPPREQTVAKQPSPPAVTMFPRRQTAIPAMLPTHH